MKGSDGVSINYDTKSAYACSLHISKSQIKKFFRMPDNITLPRDYKPSHYKLSLSDLDFQAWTYRGTVRHVAPRRTSA
ncbi:hypothetical protein LLEC1_08048 [Akanthomyces lecanii]|uniref:Uncharacterized protein n=1 Tax=Cordyceps confragosa TaxID=2714763 RepID=A0A179I1E6_CORDF|nr:hypothetical protein LLEC1_08048 [Akanthomyces lecanii]